MSLAVDLTQEIADLQEQLADEDARHAAERERLTAEIAEAEAQRAHVAAGTSVEARSLALGLIEIRGDVDRVDDAVIVDAVEDLAAGCPTLLSEYLAIKDYGRFTGQRSDHRYGYGPKHGYIVFGVGLTASSREFHRRWGSLPAGENDERIEAATCYLLNLKTAGVR